MDSGSAIWKGPLEVTETQAERTGEVSGGVWVLFFVILVAGRLALPFVATDVGLTHSRIVESLLQGQNWGRQALVGSLDFPTLTTLGLLVAGMVARCWPFPALGIDPVRLLVAWAQAWALMYLVRTALPEKRSWVVLPILGAIVAVPDVRDAVIALDPNWVVVVPLSGLFYHAARWHRTNALRDVIICAMNLGLLAFAGLPGAIVAFVVLAVLCHNVRRFSVVAKSEQGGVKLLIWAPFCYCAFLWLLWNRLVMHDMLFGIKHLWGAVCGCDAESLLEGVRQALASTSFVALAGGVVLVLSLRTDAHGAATCLLAGGCAAVFSHSFLRGIGAFAPGGGIIVLALAAMGIAIPVLQLEWGPATRWRLMVAVPAAGACIAIACVRPAPPLSSEADYMRPAPPAEAIAAWIDRFWPESRVTVYGVAAPAIYHDLTEKRFVAQLDFREQDFLTRARREQIHLLVPPPSGVFYPARRGRLEDIHGKGRPWLLLEKTWGEGWQLWRCALPPEGESKLQELE